MVCGLQKDYNLFLTFRTLKSKEIPSMPHVVCEACIGCKRTDCVDVCPVDCFREGPNFLVIDPDECIDCAVCIPECPEAAIFAEEDVPEDQQEFIAAIAHQHIGLAQVAQDGLCHALQGLIAHQMAEPVVDLLEVIHVDHHYAFHLFALRKEALEVLAGVCSGQRIHKGAAVKVGAAQGSVEAVYGSSSYKIGRAVTWLPRNAKRGLKYLLHNGPVISAKYIYTYAKYHKIANKEYAYWACLQKKDYPEALKKWFLETNYTHTPLDLEHPKSFSEKTQWLKLYGGFEDVYPLVDKYAVREWVKEKIGEEYLIPLLGVWDRFDDIDFDKLPDKFMLKVNHGAGWNIAVQDKSKFDKADAKRKIESWLKLNYCYLMGGLDVQYIHIKPRIIAEKFIENGGGDLYDYKIFCFNGEPKIILHIEERYTDKEERMFFLDTDWNQLPFNINVPLELDADLPRPANLEKMLDIARTLSQGYTAVRVDLYSLNDGSIKFGEMTFTTESGISRWHPESANDFMGSLIHLPGVDDAPAEGNA